MSSTVTEMSRSTHLGLRGVMSIGAVLSAVGSVGYVVLNFSGGTPREAYAQPVSVVSCTLAAIGAVCLAFALLRWRTTLPQWALTASAAGLVVTAANSWFFGTGIVAIADRTSDDLFMDIGESAWIMAMSAPKMVLCLVAFLAMAIVGWRDRSIPRAASLALAVSAVLSLIPPHPPGLLFAALAFFVISRGDMVPKA